MAHDQSDENADELRWMQAAAFMDLHGEMWLTRALSLLESTPLEQSDVVDRWVDIIQKMRTISESARH